MSTHVIRGLVSQSEGLTHTREGGDFTTDPAPGHHVLYTYGRTHEGEMAETYGYVSQAEVNSVEFWEELDEERGVETVLMSEDEPHSGISSDWGGGEILGRWYIVGNGSGSGTFDGSMEYDNANDAVEAWKEMALEYVEEGWTMTHASLVTQNKRHPHSNPVEYTADADYVRGEYKIMSTYETDHANLTDEEEVIDKLISETTAPGSWSHVNGTIYLTQGEHASRFVQIVPFEG